LVIDVVWQLNLAVADMSFSSNSSNVLSLIIEAGSVKKKKKIKD
jgi:hypothetical protein